MMAQRDRQNSVVPSEKKLRGNSKHISVFLRPLVLAIGVVVVIFGLYEIVERTWLADTDIQTLHLLHILRGVISSIVAACVVGWSILRASNPLLAKASLDEPASDIARLTDKQRIANYTRWFILMRWIAIVVAMTLVLIVVKIANLLSHEVWHPLWITIAMLAACNIMYSFFLRNNWVTESFLLLQVYVDLVILTVLLHFSGGIENPLTLLMLFHVIIGGIILSRRHCYEVATVAGLLFAVMACAEWADVLDHHTLLVFPHSDQDEDILHAAHQPLFVASRMGMQCVILFLTAYFVTTLAERMRHDEQQLEAMADRALAQRQLLERALETTGTGLRVVDRDLSSFWANSLWRSWFSFSDEAGSKTTGQLDGADAPARKTLLEGSISVMELSLNNRGAGMTGSTGSQRVFQVTTAPLVDREGKIVQAVELAQDITEHKKVQAKMIQTSKMAAVGELAGHVAHEVNNPLAIIGAKARLLLSDHRDSMSEKVRSELEKIVHLSDRVTDIAQGLLSYCRPSGAVRELLDIRGPLQKSRAMIDQRASTSNIKIKEDLSEPLSLVRVNAGEMEQVFLNLFLNALDAMGEGGSLTISASSAQTFLTGGQPCVTVVIQDTGPGIAADIQDRIFEPFFSTKQSGKGTGLGLSICMGLIGSHGGDIRFESEQQNGTRFVIRLPIEAQTEGTA